MLVTSTKQIALHPNGCTILIGEGIRGAIPTFAGALGMARYTLFTRPDEYVTLLPEVLAQIMEHGARLGLQLGTSAPLVPEEIIKCLGFDDMDLFDVYPRSVDDVTMWNTQDALIKLSMMHRDDQPLACVMWWPTRGESVCVTKHAMSGYDVINPRNALYVHETSVLMLGEACDGTLTQGVHGEPFRAIYLCQSDLRDDGGKGKEEEDEESLVRFESGATTPSIVDSHGTDQSSPPAAAAVLWDEPTVEAMLDDMQRVDEVVKKAPVRKKRAAAKTSKRPRGRATTKGKSTKGKRKAPRKAPVKSARKKGKAATTTKKKKTAKEKE